MGRSDILKRLIDAIIIINTVLVVGGLFVVSYDRARVGTAHWTPPTPPEQLDPYKHLRSHFDPIL
jgi:hypothetical protein